MSKIFGPYKRRRVLFVSEHARRHDVTPIITFDQPLWWKALMIPTTEPERDGPSFGRIAYRHELPLMHGPPHEIRAHLIVDA